MAKAKHMAAEALALTAAERLARVRMRLDETRAQIAAVAQRTDDRRRGLDGLQHLAQSERERAKDAERAQQAAEEAIIEARVALLLSEGTDGEEDAREALAAAERDADERAAERDAARQSAAEIEAKSAEEQRAIRTELETDERARDDLQRLLASLEKQEKTAHAAAGVEALQAAHAQHAALTAMIAEQRAALAVSEVDLRGLQAQVHGDLAAEWPAIVSTREYAEILPAHGALFDVAAATGALLDALERNAGAGADVFGVWIEPDPRNPYDQPRNLLTVLQALDGALLLGVLGSAAPDAERQRARGRGLREWLRQLCDVARQKQAVRLDETTPTPAA